MHGMRRIISTITANTGMKWHSIKLSTTCFRNISNKQICIIKLQKQLPQNILDIKITNVFKEVTGKFTEKDTERLLSATVRMHHIRKVPKSLLEWANEEAPCSDLKLSLANTKDEKVC